MRVAVGRSARLRTFYTADGKSLEFKWAHAMSIEVGESGRILAPPKKSFHRREISKANCPGARTM